MISSFGKLDDMVEEFQKVVKTLNELITNTKIKNIFEHQHILQKIEYVDESNPTAIFFNDESILDSKQKKEIYKDKFATFYLVKYIDFKEYIENISKLPLNKKFQLYRFNNDFKNHNYYDVKLNILYKNSNQLLNNNNPYINLHGINSCLENYNTPNYCYLF